MSKSKFIFFFIFLIIIDFSLEGTKSKVENLFQDYKGEIYSGYLKTLIEGNELFYVFTPSQSSPSEDPVLLWLNGGPGCSSLFGMLGEIGPVTTDNFSGEFKNNPYAWNKNINTLFIEQPAGVGFSKCSDIHHKWTDVENAKNLFAGVVDFFEVFEELKGRDFYISGESYAGIFIPHLAVEILQDTEKRVNLKGFMIGNALTDPTVDYDRSLVEFGFWRGIISIENYNGFERNCPHLPDELLPDRNDKPEYNVTEKCNEYERKISDEMNGNDVYGIYRPCPFEEDSVKNKNSMRKKILDEIKKNSKKIKKNYFKNYSEDEEGVWPNKDCGEDTTVDTFLNLNSTKEKLNVFDMDTVWTQCAELDYEWSDSIHLYNSTLLEYPDLKMWLISGTEDGVISTLGTMRWIDKVGFNVEKEWTQWKLNDQVAGYNQKYKEGLVLVTIKGAGHMAPQDKREQAKFVIDSFIKGILPSENKNQK